jgi:hypothetical protein
MAVHKKRSKINSNSDKSERSGKPAIIFSWISWKRFKNNLFVSSVVEDTSTRIHWATVREVRAFLSIVKTSASVRFSNDDTISLDVRIQLFFRFNFYLWFFILSHNRDKDHWSFTVICVEDRIELKLLSLTLLLVACKDSVINGLKLTTLER